MVAEANERLADRFVRRLTNLVACTEETCFEDSRQSHVTYELGHSLVVQGDQTEEFAEVLSFALEDEVVDVEACRAFFELLVTLGHLVNDILVQNVCWETKSC